MVKPKSVISKLLWIVVVAGWIWFGVSALDRRPRAINQAVEAVTLPFKNNEDLRYSWRGEVKRVCKGVFLRSIHQNGIVFDLADHTFSEAIPIGKRVVVVSTEIQGLKNVLKNGPAQYHVREVAYCNMAQQLLHWPIVSEHPVVHFTVYDSR